MTRPRLLDLFCGAGGAAVGYHRAGFDVTGVDVVDQPRFPFEFVRADAITFPFDGFDAIHASPPCHDHSALLGPAGGRDGTGFMLAAMLYRMGIQDRPWIVENVERAKLGDAWVTVCGASLGLAVETPGFGRRWLKRHRRFRSNVGLLVPPCMCHRSRRVIGVYGDLSRGDRRARDTPEHVTRAGVATARELLGIPWMTATELTQAIPPAYTEMLGGQLIGAIEGGQVLTG